MAKLRVYRFKSVAIIIVLTFLITLNISNAKAQSEIVLASWEKNPYITSTYGNGGYVVEVIEKAFEKSEYSLKLEFFPYARTIFTAQKGKVSGFAPAYMDETNTGFYYSDPFPGDFIGLLKRKDFDVQYSVNPQDDLKAALEPLKGYSFGVLNGFSFHPAFDNDTTIQKEPISRQLKNIDKLARGRVDFIVIDKYTAADLITTDRPQLIGQLEFMKPALVNKNFHVAFSKKSPTHQQDLKAFNKGLKILSETGELLEIRKKHGLYPPVEQDGEKTKLIIGTVDNSDMKIMEEISKKYYEDVNPNIEIEWRALDENTLRKRLLGDISINDGQFDILSIGTYEAPIWAEREWLHGLKEVLPDNYDLEDLIKPVKDALSYEDELYALPFYAESSMTYYNKELFSQANLKMPEYPTYLEIMDFAQKIHNLDKGIYGICIRGKGGWGSNLGPFTSMVNSYGGRWFNEDWQPQLTTEPWRKALVDFKKLSLYAHPNSYKYNFNENKELFSEGKCGIWVDATIAAGALFDPKQSKVHDKTGYAFAPKAKTSKGSHWLWAWSLAVPSSSRNKEEAAKFISWATSKGYINQVAENKGWVAVPAGTRISTYENPNYQSLAPFAEFVLNTIQKANTTDQTLEPVPYKGIQYVSIPEFASFGDLVGLEIQKAIEGLQTTDQALEQAYNIVKERMKAAGYLEQ